MKCPNCGKRTRVVDSRPREGAVWRRRRCAEGHLSHTFENYAGEELQGARDKAAEIIEKAEARAKSIIVRARAEKILLEEPEKIEKKVKAARKTRKIEKKVKTVEWTPPSVTKKTPLWVKAMLERATTLA